MREDRCVDLLRWNDNKFKELGRKLKFRAEIGQKMSFTAKNWPKIVKKKTKNQKPKTKNGKIMKF